MAAPAEAQLFGGNGLKEILGGRERVPRLGPPKDPGIPTPVDLELEAVKGKEITFELKAESKTPAARVEFLVRDFPRAGRIVALINSPNHRNRAVVTYLADGESAATTDSFTFAVRYPGGRYSSVAQVEIDLEGVTSLIEVTEAIEFGTVTIGEEAVKTINIRNRGDGPFIRQLMPAPPWHVVDPPEGKLNIGPRGYGQVEIAFRPTLSGEANFLLPVSRSKKGLCKLRGEGRVPFSLNTEEIRLAYDPETNRRTGAVVLENLGGKPVLLGLRGSSRLVASLGRDMVLAPGKKTRKEIQLGSTDVAAFQGTVEFLLGDSYAATARVSADPVPGRLAISIPNSASTEVLNFGQVGAGTTTERGFLVRNEGGTPVPLELEVGDPFRVLGQVPEEIPPLGSATIALGFSPTFDEAGKTDQRIRVMGLDQVLPVRVLANVIRSKNAPRFAMSREEDAAAGEAGNPQDASADAGIRAVGEPSGIAAAPDSTAPESGSGQSAGEEAASSPPERESFAGSIGAGGEVEVTGEHPFGDDFRFNPALLREHPYDGMTAEEREEFRTPLGFETLPLNQRRTDPGLRGAEDLEVVSAGARDLTLTFTAPPHSEHYRFELETMGMVNAAGEGPGPRSVWVPYPAVEFERIGRMVKAEVKVPSPASEYQFRVITTNENGYSAPPSEAIVATSGLPMDWTWIYAGLGAVLVVGLGWALRRIYLNRRPEVYQSQYVDS